jgi:predicted membrane protein (TIGR00267 family)
LTALGVILGAFAVGELSKGIVMGAAVGAGIALAMSGIISAYEVERLENKMRLQKISAYEVERLENKMRLQKIEKAMMKKTGELHLNASRFATIITAIVYSISALATIFIPVIPFFVFEPIIAMYVAIFVYFSVV